MPRVPCPPVSRRTFLKLAGATALSVGHGPLLRADDAAGGRPEGKRLIVHSTAPLNGEPDLDDLVKSWLTPLEHFYVRCNGTVPQIDPADFVLSVEGLVERPLRVTLAELKETFPGTSVVATLTCAGNRRSEFNEQADPSRPKIDGVQWRAGAIGNARWGGVRLSDLLKKAGVKDGAKHVWFEGLDEIAGSRGPFSFGASIPLEKALADTRPTPGALIAFEMNGRPLTPEHGFPIRTVVPGYIGARSVKWLGKIIVSDRPSDNYYVARSYKLVTEGTPEAWAAVEPIGEYPLNSVICLPKAGDDVRSGRTTVRGYALPPGRAGRTLAAVEVSADEGRTWSKARLTTAARAFCWQLWDADIEFAADTRSLLVRATDSSGAVQPQTAAWNLKGYLNNGWHRVPLRG